MKKYDAIIIGSGQAGTPLAFKLATEGQKVAFIEKEKVGGTCLNFGCTPTKTYVASARRMWDIQKAKAMGVQISQQPSIDLPAVKRRKDEMIEKSVSGILNGLDKNENIDLYQGAASFSGQKEVSVNGKRITAEEIYINVGGRSFIPPEFEDIPHLDNKSILELTELPRHLIIVGGSYIGLEFGQMFRRFGSEVTIIERGATIIKREDEDVSHSILEFMKEEGVNFRLNATCLGGEKTTDGLKVQVDCENGEPAVEGSHLLLAVGRKPNTDSLNLPATGLETNSRGQIEVDDYLETSVPGIYALGDCNGRGAFTHTAYNDYEIIAANKFDGQNRKVSDRILTYGLFVDPPLGRVGLSKKEALARGYQIKEAFRPMDKVARAKEKGETKGFMRAIIDAKTDRILGAAVLGVGGDEVIGGITNLMYADAPYTVLRDSVQVHPTVSELVPTMLENLK